MVHYWWHIAGKFSVSTLRFFRIPIFSIGWFRNKTIESSGIDHHRVITIKDGCTAFRVCGCIVHQEKAQIVKDDGAES